MVNLAKFPVDADADTDDLTWQSSQVEDFIRLRALLWLEGTYPKDGSFKKVMVVASLVSLIDKCFRTRSRKQMTHQTQR